MADLSASFLFGTLPGPQPDSLASTGFTGEHRILQDNETGAVADPVPGFATAPVYLLRAKISPPKCAVIAFGGEIIQQITISEAGIIRASDGL